MYRAPRSSAIASLTSTRPAESPVAVTRPIRTPSASSAEYCRISTVTSSSVAMSRPSSCTVAVTTRLPAANVMIGAGTGGSASSTGGTIAAARATAKMPADSIDDVASSCMRLE